MDNNAPEVGLSHRVSRDIYELIARLEDGEDVGIEWVDRLAAAANIIAAYRNVTVSDDATFTIDDVQRQEIWKLSNVAWISHNAHHTVDFARCNHDSCRIARVVLNGYVI